MVLRLRLFLLYGLVMSGCFDLRCVILWGLGVVLLGVALFWCFSLCLMLVVW